MGPLGVPEMIFIFVAALVVFGPKQLPELGKKLGKGLSEFRKASTELKSTFQREMDSIERETRMQDVRQAASDIKSDIQKDFSPSAMLKGDDEIYDEYDHYDSPPAKSTSAARSDTATGEPSVATSTENSSAVDSGAEKGVA
jgi:TatA/E family protein of Tat protein translocase